MSKYIPDNKLQRFYRMQKQPSDISVLFHKGNLLGLKKALGKKCTAVTHVKFAKHTLEPVLNKEGNAKQGMFKRVEKDSQYGIVAKFGKQNPLTAMLNGTPFDIKGEYYMQLKRDMTNAARKKGLL